MKISSRRKFPKFVISPMLQWYDWIWLQPRMVQVNLGDSFIKLFALLSVWFLEVLLRFMKICSTLENSWDSCQKFPFIPQTIKVPVMESLGPQERQQIISLLSPDKTFPSPRKFWMNPYCFCCPISTRKHLHVASSSLLLWKFGSTMLFIHRLSSI